jgi:hypothetical protein
VAPSPAILVDADGVTPFGTGGKVQLKAMLSFWLITSAGMEGHRVGRVCASSEALAQGAD